MNRKSLRFRMTLWYASALSLSIIIIFSSFYFITKQTLLNYTDNILSSHASKVVEIVKKQNLGMHQYLADQGFLQEFSEIPGMLVVIKDKLGETVSGTVGIDPQNTTFNDLFRIALNTRKPFFSNQNTGSLAMRFFVSPVEQKNKFSGVVLIAHPVDVIQMSLNSLLIIMGAVFIVLSIFTIIGGYLLAATALEPIAATSAKLKKIETENLEERIVNPQTGDEIEELILTFNALLDRLKTAVERERQFIGNVAHTLKTPLAILKSNVELTICKKRSNRRYEKTFSEMLIDINRASVTLNNILTLAWSKSEDIKAQDKIFDFSELVEELKDIAKTMSVQKNITISAKVAVGVRLLGKRNELARAVLNIIDNAIKFTLNNGQISITLQNRKNIVLKIEDNGIGIGPKDLPHIFENFYRGETSDKTEGSGLGLTIAQAIINAHHGTLNVISNVGKGTTITIILPKP